MNVMQSPTLHIESDNLPWEVVGNGVKRKIVAYDEKIMMVLVDFEKDAIGAVHQHYHTQITYIESGSFEVEVDGQKRILKGGDIFFAPSNLWHGVVCHAPGRLVDVFSPHREDFIK